MAFEADGKIEVIVGIVRISRRRLHEQPRSVVILSADRDSFVIQHLGQGQFSRHSCKRLLGLCIRAEIQERKSAVKTSLERI